MLGPLSQRQGGLGVLLSEEDSCRWLNLTVTGGTSLSPAYSSVRLYLLLWSRDGVFLGIMAVLGVRLTVPEELDLQDAARQSGGSIFSYAVQ